MPTWVIVGAIIAEAGALAFLVRLLIGEVGKNAAIIERVTASMDAMRDTLERLADRIEAKP